MFAFALVFYVLGASFLEGFVNYRTWHLIGADEFQIYHQAVTARIAPFLLVPALLMIILTVLLLLWRRPAEIPQWMVWSSLALNLFQIVVSITLQIPIQLEFDRSGLSLVLLDRLILLDWLRKAPQTLNAVLFLWMMSKVLRGREKNYVN